MVEKSRPSIFLIFLPRKRPEVLPPPVVQLTAPSHIAAFCSA